MTDRRRYVLVASLVGLAATAAAVTGRLPVGPPDIDMLVPRNAVGIPVAAGPLLAGTAAAMVVVALVAARRRIPTAGLLIALAAVTVVLDLGLHQPVPHPWSWRVLSTITLNPFFAEASRDVGAARLLADHRRRLDAGYVSERGDRRRLTTYPEGLPVAYRMVWRLASASDGIRGVAGALGRVDPEVGAGVPLARSERVTAAAGLASVLHLLAVSMLPLAAWWLARELAGRDAAAVAAALAALAPAPHLWVHDVNVLTAALPAAAAAALLLAARTRPAWAALVGAALAIGVGLTLSLLPGIAAAGLLLLTVRSQIPGARRIAATLWCAAGASATMLAAAACGSGTVGSAVLALRNSHQFYDVVQRGHWSSIGTNAVEVWLLWGGVATSAAAMAAWAAAAGLVRNPGGADARRRGAVVIAAVVLVVVVAGGVRGEIARNTMSLAPLVAVLAASDPRAGGRSGWPLVGAAAVATVMLCALMEPVLGFFVG